MAEEPPLGGSPDPVGAEPESYEEDEAQFSAGNVARVVREAELTAPGHHFDPAVDRFDAEREESYADWNADARGSGRSHFRECDTCGIAQSMGHFPPPGTPHTGTCSDCLLGTPLSERIKSDPSATLRSTKQTGFKPVIAIPVKVKQGEYLTWEQLDSPLRHHGLVLLTSGDLGLVMSRAAQERPLEHSDVRSWAEASVEVTSQARQVLRHLGFGDPIQSGVIDDVDLIGESDPFQKWKYAIVVR